MSNEVLSPAERLRDLAKCNDENAENGTANNSDFARGAASAYEDAAEFIERNPMVVTGELDEATFRMRQQIASGEIEGEEVNVSINADGMALFIEFEEERVMFSVRNMMAGAYEMVYGEQPEGMEADADE